jgi:hypothetical protein
MNEWDSSHIWRIHKKNFQLKYLKLNYKNGFCIYLYSHPHTDTQSMFHKELGHRGSRTYYINTKHLAKYYYINTSKPPIGWTHLEPRSGLRKMASTPGILTDWPWTPLGNFKVFFFTLFHICIYAIIYVHGYKFGCVVFGSTWLWLLGWFTAHTCSLLMREKTEICLTSSYFHSCCSGCSTTSYGSLFPDIKPPKAKAGLSTRASNSNKSTEKETGQ